MESCLKAQAFRVLPSRAATGFRDDVLGALLDIIVMTRTIALAPMAFPLV